jgi:predicted N-acetyltransferase YhbS
VANDSFPPVRELGPDDHGQCVALSIDRGWLPDRGKWSLLLEASEVYGIDAPDGRGLAGVVVLTRWATDLAAIGMMLVAARYGRRGVGRALMEHAIAAAGPATITLFATEMGRPLYEKLGFQPVRRNVAFVGEFRARPSEAGPGAPARIATEADQPAILALDRSAFGADRSRILSRLPGFADRISVLEAADGGPQILGYAAAWRNSPASTVIGPLVAPDPEAAKHLVADLAAHAQGTLRLDLDPDRPELPAWADKHGLTPSGRTTVMAYGDLPSRGTPDRLFAPISVALA